MSAPRPARSTDEEPSINETPARTSAHRGRRRSLALAVAALVAGADLLVKAWAQHSLPPGGLQAGPVDLRLAYNPGVAFSLAAGAPPAAVIAGTALVTACVAALVWVAAPTASRARLAALAAVLGGSVANVTDRSADGVVTDYLHSGWWPTFNIADVALVTGALLLVMTSNHTPFTASNREVP